MTMMQAQHIEDSKKSNAFLFEFGPHSSLCCSSWLAAASITQATLSELGRSNGRR